MAPRYLPFAPEPAGRRFRLRMGVRPLGRDEWLDVDEHRAGDLEQKRALLAAHHDEVVAVLEGTEEAAAEVAAEVVAWLDERGVTHAGLERGLHPIDAAARLVQEDLCLHTVVDGLLVLSAASVAFPNQWRVRDKIGRPLLAIHEPVPGYAEQVGRAVDEFLARLKPGAGVWRANWGITDDPTLAKLTGIYQSGHNAVVNAENAGTTTWLRVERQTLRRLPVHDSVLFTIRTYVTPLQELAADPVATRRLAAAIRALPPDMAHYKSLRPVAGAVLAWLDARAGGAAMMGD